MNFESQILGHNAEKNNQNDFDSFESAESVEDKDLIEKLMTRHDKMLARGEFGSGMNARVFNFTGGDDDQPFCVKAAWNEIIIHGEHEDFPEFVDSLREQKQYFDDIAEYKRRKEATGTRYSEQLKDPVAEANYTNRAKRCVEDAGHDVVIPKVSKIVHIVRGEEAEDVNDFWYEDVDLMMMTKVSGVNVQEFVLGSGREIVIEDIESFGSELHKALKTLHDAGIHHNDISNRNIMITEEGKPAIIDFGATVETRGAHASELYERDKKRLDNVIRIIRQSMNNFEGTRDKLSSRLDEIQF